ncbi:MAG: TraB domain-containing protein [Promethearchaeota archaeon]
MPFISERLIIVGVVHGQKSCMEQVKNTILQVTPEVVAIELPVMPIPENLNNVENEIQRISDQYHNFFNGLKLLGFSESVARNLEILATGFSLQGAEFLAAIKAAKDVGAIIEFIDMTRDRIFWEVLIEILNHLSRHPRDTMDRQENHSGIMSWFEIPPLHIPTLKEISNTIKYTIHEWKNTLDILISIYKEEDYNKLSEIVSPLVKQMGFNPVLNEILVEQRNRYMANKLTKLLKDHEGKIVLVTGFGHIEGIKRLIDKEFNS